MVATEMSGQCQLTLYEVLALIKGRPLLIPALQDAISITVLQQGRR